MRTKLLLVVALSLGLVASLGPAQASSLYHMNGQGSLTIFGGGLPACLPVANVPDCANVDVTFSWNELVVQGAGLLQDQQISGQYSCKSEGSIGNVPFVSKIYGNTSNFQLTFNFQCTRLQGVGPQYINGWFSNVTANLTGPYHNVSSHPHPTPVAPGAPTFKGFFATSNIHPYSIGASNGDAMSCGGGFAPTTVSGTRLTTAAFLGACTALEA